MKKTTAVLMACVAVSAWRLNASEIGFMEDFSLADDRKEALKQLIPGTEDYYYFTCLQAQNTGALADVKPAVDLWIKRYGYTPRVKEILNRQALLEYDKDPRRSLSAIQRDLGLTFDYRREIADRKTDFPTRLDPATIAPSSLLRSAFARYQNLQGIEDAGLDALPFADLDGTRRRDLLRRLTRPDIPGLAKLVVDDLHFENSGGFGSIAIHAFLLPDQLEECARLMPELKEQVNYINAVISKLRPADEVDLRSDAKEKRAYIEKLVAYTRALAPAHNSLKAHALYQLLDLDRREGIHNLALFMEYIQLPRQVAYINPDFLNQPENRLVRADLNANFNAVTRLPPVHGDEALVRDYLAHAFLTAEDTAAFAKFIRDDYLKDVFVETKIVNGLGDPEKWFALITPTRYQALKERVDLDFAVSNRTFFAADEALSLDLCVKNIDTLIVKVFEINAFNYYRAKQEELNPALDLDGLVATDEQVIKYKETPLRRMPRTFAFPQCDKPGVYAIEFIGNGRSSRALIRKGQLRTIEKIGPAGHEFVVLDDVSRRRPSATIWLGGREFKPDAQGVIIVPFSTEPGSAKMIIRDGDFCSLAVFDHHGEDYALSAGFYVDRESLLKGAKARVLVRPTLRLDGYPVSLTLLKEVRLRITSTDNQGIVTVKDVPDFALFEDREATYEFQVPPNLANVAFELKGKVRNVSRQRDDDVIGSGAFAVNGVDKTDQVDDLHFRRTDAGYAIELLGKNGEPKAGRPVHVVLKHRAFRDSVDAALQTDAAGRIDLGPLPGIDSVNARVSDSLTDTWQPTRDEVAYPQSLHGVAGGTLRVPFFAGDSEPRLQYALLEKRGGTYMADRIGAAQIHDGFLDLTGLPAGDFELTLKDTRTAPIAVRLTAGTVESGCVVSDRRTLQLGNTAPLQIAALQMSDTNLTITVANATPVTRVHVLAMRYAPAHSAFGCLSYPRPEPYVEKRVKPESQYIAGRDIGDEYRYVLDRKYAHKFAGTLLNRPGLLLNPWSLRKSDTAEQLAQAGEALNGMAPGLYANRTAGGRAGALDRFGGSREKTDDLDYLAEPSLVIINLKPDAQGRIVVDRSALGAHPFVRVVAVDPLTVVSRDLALADTKPAMRDLRQVQALDSAKHFTEQKIVSVVPQAGGLEIKDITTSEINLYDSLDKVFNLLSTLSGNGTLNEFSFVLRWPELSATEKRTLYGKHACHELNFFLYQKDRVFFEEVILPYLKNKKDKTFMDQWLTGGNLTPWTQPWAFAQLNIVEQILLAQRGVTPADRMSRYVGDLCDMIPPDVADYNRRFDTGIRTAVLETGDALGFEAAKGEAVEKQLEQVAIVNAPVAMAATAPASPAPSGAAHLAAKPQRMLMARQQAAAQDALRDVAGEEDLKSVDALQRADDKPASGKRAAYRRKSAAEAEAKKAELFYDARNAEREEAVAFFRQLDKTEEWAENNYYHLPIEAQIASLVTVNPFWSDYARHDGKTPFLSGNVLYASRNFTEVMLALAVLDLPFKAAAHKTDAQGPSFTLTAGSPLLAFHQQIKEGAAAKDKPPILVSQNYFRADDRYRFVGNERLDKFVTEEFLAQVDYGCQVVLVNPTSSRQTLRLLLQVPQGALPVQNGFYTRGIPVVLEPYATHTVEYFFYFPAPGAYPHYPVQVAQNEQFVAGTAPFALNVVTKLSKIDTESWDYVSQNGTPEEVVAFLQNHNLNRVNLARIAWRMTDKAYFQNVVALLMERHVYDDTLWSFGLKHDVLDMAREYLKRSDFANRCGAYIDSRLLTIDPVERKTYQHLEYKPLVNARAHALGKRRQILNDRFFEQYERFLTVLSCRPALTQDDLLAVTYYLLLQDRTDDALRFFKRVDAASVVARVQYDYLQVYLDFCLGEPGPAREIAARYKDYSVPTWRDLFADALNQLEELEGKAAALADKDDRTQAQTRAASREPGFDFKVEARQIALNYRNIETCRINYYPMDIELLFSRNPFVQQQTDQFAFIRPAASEEIKLATGKDSVTLDIPKKFSSSNVMVEIAAAGVRKSQAYYANSLAVQVTETFGQVQVSQEATHKPLAKVYVKVYARMKDGSVRFFKDGYTDMRGRFDYASVSTNEGDNVDRFALLILSEEAGAVIREAAPPKT